MDMNAEFSLTPDMNKINQEMKKLVNHMKKVFKQVDLLESMIDVKKSTKDINKLANEIMQCSIDFFNTHREEDTEFDPGEEALRIAKYAKSIGATGQVKNRIIENTQPIQDWVDNSPSHFLSTLFKYTCKFSIGANYKYKI